MCSETTGNKNVEWVHAIAMSEDGGETWGTAEILPMVTGKSHI